MYVHLHFAKVNNIFQLPAYRCKKKQIKAAITERTSQTNLNPRIENLPQTKIEELSLHYLRTKYILRLTEIVEENCAPDSKKDSFYETAKKLPQVCEQK